MKISIIICTHNVGKRLEKTLDSILGQDFDDCEIVVIDGVSTDGTIEIIKEYEKKFDGKLRWISEKDSGIYNAMNKGVRMAQGEFLNIIGAGDWYEKEIFKKVSETIKRNPDMDVMYGRTRVWDSALENSYEKQTLPATLLKEPMQHPALFYRNNLHDKFGFYDEKYKIASDYAFCLKAFHQGKAKIKIVPEIFCNFVTDGISSKRRFLSLRENSQIKQEFGVKTSFLKEVFLSTRIAKILCQK